MQLVRAELLSSRQERIQAMNSDIEPADTFDLDRPIGDASATITTD